MSDTLNVQPGSGLTFPWTEYVSRSGFTASGKFKADNAQWTMQIDINPADLENAIGQLLGYPTTLNPSTGLEDGLLHRILPWQHQYFTFMYCTEITNIVGIGFSGRPTIVGLGTNTSPATYAAPYSNPIRYRLSLLFTTPPYAVLSDDQLTKNKGGLESERFVIRIPTPKVDMVAITKYPFVYAPGTPKAITNSQFNGSISQRLSKPVHIWTWLNVPDNYLFNKAGVPANIDDALGRINLTCFAGMPESTLLFQACKLIPRTAPVNPAFMGILDLGAPPRMWDVELHFAEFNPNDDYTVPDPAGFGFPKVTSTPPIAGTGVGGIGPQGRGWLLAPSPQNSLTGIWYKVVSKDGNQPLYQSAEFANIFTKAPNKVILH